MAQIARLLEPKTPPPDPRVVAESRGASYWRLVRSKVLEKQGGGETCLSPTDVMSIPRSPSYHGISGSFSAEVQGRSDDDIKADEEAKRHLGNLASMTTQTLSESFVLPAPFTPPPPTAAPSAAPDGGLRLAAAAIEALSEQLRAERARSEKAEQRVRVLEAALEATRQAELRSATWNVRAASGVASKMEDDKTQCTAGSLCSACSAYDSALESCWDDIEACLPSTTTS